MRERKERGGKKERYPEESRCQSVEVLPASTPWWKPPAPGQRAMTSGCVVLTETKTKVRWLREALWKCSETNYFPLPSVYCAQGNRKANQILFFVLNSWAAHLIGKREFNWDVTCWTRNCSDKNKRSMTSSSCIKIKGPFKLFLIFHRFSCR